jgi:hypothetical protein
MKHTFTLSKHASERLFERKGIRVPSGSVIASESLDWLYGEIYRYGSTFFVVKNNVVLTAY